MGQGLGIRERGALGLRATLVICLALVVAGVSASSQPALADGRCSTSTGSVESRIAAFWQCVGALGPVDQLMAEDLGQWARNVAERDPGAGIRVDDFRATTADMQSALDRASAGIPPQPPKTPDVEQRIALFWQRVSALGPADLLTAADLGQWALNVIDRDPSKRIRVDDFRATTGDMQAAFDRARSLQPTAIVNRTSHGHLRWNETWRGEFRVTGDIQVEPGFTLTIEPGARILIAANSDAENLNTDPQEMRQGIRPYTAGSAGDENSIQWGEPFRDEGHHIFIGIYGTLHAVGTPDRMITITSDSPTPGVYDWTGLRFADGVLSYATVEYYRYMYIAPGAQVPPVISHNTLRHIGESAVGSANGTAAILIENNTISDAGHELIDMHSASLVIRNNHLGPNPMRKNPGGLFGAGVGIIIDGGQPQITGNTIDGTNVGIVYLSPTPGAVIENNVLSNNKEDIRHQ